MRDSKQSNPSKKWNGGFCGFEKREEIVKCHSVTTALQSREGSGDLLGNVHTVSRAVSQMSWVSRAIRGGTHLQSQPLKGGGRKITRLVPAWAS